MYKICLVEDEINLNNLIKNYLEHENYNVISAYNGKEALNMVDNKKIDLWILDIMLGDEFTGYDVIKKIKEKDQDVPVIFTSARDQDLDKIIGLELGSDDYVTKPYSPKELVLRVNKLINRIYKETSSNLLYESYIIDPKKRIVIENGNEIKLTTLEFDLLMLLMNNKTSSFSREEILIKIWGNDYYGSDRVVDDLVRRLRKKMPRLRVNTLYGFGYRLT